MQTKPRYVLRTPYSLTIRNSARLFHHVPFNMGDLHLVLPARNLSNLFDKDAISKIDDVLTELSGLLHVLPLAVHPEFVLLDKLGGPL